MSKGNSESKDGTMPSSKEQIELLLLTAPCGLDFKPRTFTFSVSTNEGGGNCLFMSLGQCDLGEDELDHHEIRQKVVQFAIQDNNWENFQPTLLYQHVNEIREFKRKDTTNEKLIRAYRNFMQSSRVFGTTDELLIASLKWRFNFSILKSSPKPKSTGRRRGSGPSEHIPVNYTLMHFRLPDAIRLEEDGTEKKFPWFYFRFDGDVNCGHWENLVLIEPE